ncbi:MAG: hypothetical protein IT282_17345 [Bacteroidetes bacterium]|nr:hypothetical protein [Bacteroidota bacterium]
MVEVQVEGPQSTQEGSLEGFTLALSNVSRIEASWKFEEGSLALLIRMVEEWR